MTQPPTAVGGFVNRPGSVSVGSATWPNHGAGGEHLQPDGSEGPCRVSNTLNPKSKRAQRLGGWNRGGAQTPSWLRTDADKGRSSFFPNGSRQATPPCTLTTASVRTDMNPVGPTACGSRMAHFANTAASSADR
jgi:hypothetical protein